MWASMDCRRDEVCRIVGNDWYRRRNRPLDRRSVGSTGGRLSAKQINVYTIAVHLYARVSRTGTASLQQANIVFILIRAPDER